MFISIYEFIYVLICLFILSREVEDFARRLNSDWPERMQEILSLGHERRLVPMSINGDGPMSRFTSEQHSKVS